MKIAILGLGWLGIPLAQHLLKLSCFIKGSTTTISKIQTLENLGIETHLIKLNSKEIEGNCKAFLENVDILVIDIPPQLRKNNTESFVEKIELLIPEIVNAHIKKVVFISSISVFSDHESTITEETYPNPTSENGKQLWEAEQRLQACNSFQTTVIRFGGLIGNERHPVYYLAGKEHLENPNAPVNLIHLKDCIGVISTVLWSQKHFHLIHAVAPQHPTRKEYYTQKAIDFKLELPRFDNNNKNQGKKVISNILINQLDYQFIEEI